MKSLRVLNVFWTAVLAVVCVVAVPHRAWATGCPPVSLNVAGSSVSQVLAVEPELVSTSGTTARYDVHLTNLADAWYIVAEGNPYNPGTCWPTVWSGLLPRGFSIADPSWDLVELLGPNSEIVIRNVTVADGDRMALCTIGADMDGFASPDRRPYAVNVALAFIADVFVQLTLGMDLVTLAYDAVGGGSAEEWLDTILEAIDPILDSADFDSVIPVLEAVRDVGEVNGLGDYLRMPTRILTLASAVLELVDDFSGPIYHALVNGLGASASRTGAMLDMLDNAGDAVVEIADRVAVVMDFYNAAKVWTMVDNGQVALTASSGTTSLPVGNVLSPPRESIVGNTVRIVGTASDRCTAVQKVNLTMTTDNWATWRFIGSDFSRDADGRYVFDVNLTDVADGTTVRFGWDVYATDGRFANSPSGNLVVTKDAAAVAARSRNLMYVSDGTTPIGTQVVAGSTFTKGWYVRNTGATTWPAGTVLRRVGGTSLGLDTIPVSSLAVGASASLSGSLRAPTTLGTVTAVYRAQAPDGVYFGDSLVASVVVVTAPPPPGASGVACGSSTAGSSATSAPLRATGHYDSIPICATETQWWAIDVGSGSRVQVQATPDAGAAARVELRSSPTTVVGSATGGPVTGVASQAGRWYALVTTTTADGTRYDLDVTVTPRQAASGIVVTTELSLSPATSIEVYDDLSATFRIRNDNAVTVAVDAVAVRGVDGAGAVVNFPNSPVVTLSPGGSYVYTRSLPMPRAGAYTFRPSVQIDGVWLDLDTPSGAAAASRSVSVTAASTPVWSVLNWATTTTGAAGPAAVVFADGSPPYFWLRLSNLPSGTTTVQFNVAYFREGADPSTGQYHNSFQATATGPGTRDFVAHPTRGVLGIPAGYGFRVDAYVNTGSGFVDLERPLFFTYGDVGYVEGWSYKGDERSSVCIFLSGECYPLHSEPFYFHFYPDDPYFARTVWIDQAEYDSLTSTAPCVIGRSYDAAGTPGCILHDPFLPGAYEYALIDGTELRRANLSAVETCFGADLVVSSEGITSIPGVFDFVDSAGSPGYCDPSLAPVVSECGPCQTTERRCSMATCLWSTTSCASGCDSAEECQDGACVRPIDLIPGAVTTPAEGAVLHYDNVVFAWRTGDEAGGASTSSALYCRFDYADWERVSGFSSDDDSTFMDLEPGSTVECMVRTRLSDDTSVYVDSPSRTWLVDDCYSNLRIASIVYDPERSPPAGCDEATFNFEVENSGELAGVWRLEAWVVPAGADSTHPSAVRSRTTPTLRTGPSSSEIVRIEVDVPGRLSVDEGEWEVVARLYDLDSWAPEHNVRVDAAYPDAAPPQITRFLFFGISGTPAGVLPGRTYAAQLGASDDFGVARMGWRWRPVGGTWTEIAQFEEPLDTCRGTIGPGETSWVVSSGLTAGTNLELEVWAVDYAGNRSASVQTLIVKSTGTPSLTFYSPNSNTVVGPVSMAAPSPCLPLDFEVVTPIALSSVRTDLVGPDGTIRTESIRTFASSVVGSGGRITHCGSESESGDQMRVRAIVRDTNGDLTTFYSEPFSMPRDLLPWPWAVRPPAAPVNTPGIVTYSIAATSGDSVTLTQTTSALHVPTGDTEHRQATVTVDWATLAVGTPVVDLASVVLPPSSLFVGAGHVVQTEVVEVSACDDPWTQRCDYRVDAVTFDDGVETARATIGTYTQVLRSPVTDPAVYLAANGSSVAVVRWYNGTHYETDIYRRTTGSWSKVHSLARDLKRPVRVGDELVTISPRQPGATYLDVVVLPLSNPTAPVTQLSVNRADWASPDERLYLSRGVPTLVIADDITTRTSIWRRQGTSTWTLWTTVTPPSSIHGVDYTRYYLAEAAFSSSSAVVALQGEPASGADWDGIIVPVGPDGVARFDAASVLEGDLWAGSQLANMVLGDDGRLVWFDERLWNMQSHLMMAVADFGLPLCVTRDACETATWSSQTATCARAAVACDDGNPCNGVGACDPDTGSCVATAEPIVCDDGLACNGVETCEPLDGSCAPGAAAVVDDALSCTVDVCTEPAGVAVHTPDDERCEAAPCFVAACDPSSTAADPSSGCSMEPAPLADDGLSCTAETCDPASGQTVHTPLDGFCVIDGACVAAGARSSANGCSVCDPALATHTWSPASAGALCDDGRWCTVADACVDGTCVGTARDCLADPSAPCAIPRCDEARDQCVPVPVVDGTSCADDDVCDGAERCAAGSCAPGTPAELPPDERCVAYTCDALLGVAVEFVDGPCDADADGCTADSCVEGVCVSTPIDCGTGSDCSEPTCVSLAADQFECRGVPLTDAPCDDLDPCTAADVCLPTGVCLGTAVDADRDGISDCVDDCVGCSVPACGDGSIDAGEACDDGVANSDDLADACRLDCTEPRCGDGVVDSAEGCDEGTANSDDLADACRLDCTEPRCGDGVVDSPETCDEGAANSDDLADACRTDCSAARCGDGVVDRGESCDPGLTTDGTCTAACALVTCGDGRIDAGEECDNGGRNSNTRPDACRLSCVRAFCGDDVIDAFELCDDGASNSDSIRDACRTDCGPAFCGDGVTDSDEECDGGPAGSDTEPDACRTDCSAPRCGDGVVDSGEACDDGADNGAAVPGACSATCSVVPDIVDVGPSDAGSDAASDAGTDAGTDADPSDADADSTGDAALDADAGAPVDAADGDAADAAGDTGTGDTAADTDADATPDAHADAADAEADIAGDTSVDSSDDDTAEVGDDSTPVDTTDSAAPDDGSGDSGDDGADDRADDGAAGPRSGCGVAGGATPTGLVLAALGLAITSRRRARPRRAA